VSDPYSFILLLLLRFLDFPKLEFIILYKKSKAGFGMSKTKLFMSYVLASCFRVLFPVRHVIGGDVEFNLTDKFFGTAVSKYC
jgi:hypothetical protein